MTGSLCLSIQRCYMSSSPGAAPARGPLAAGRVGLSEYTAQRLAELRARRADADCADSTSFVKPALAPRPAAAATATGRIAADVVARTTAAASVYSAGSMAVNGLKTDTTCTTTGSVGSCSSHSDVTVASTQSHSTTVSSPPHQHHHYVTASTRSPSLNRREPSNAVDTTRAHKVRVIAELLLLLAVSRRPFLKRFTLCYQTVVL